MAYTAVTNIKYGRGSKGDSLRVEAGDSVNQSDFTDEAWDTLVEAGAVTEEDLPESANERIEELENELNTLRAQLASNTNTVSQGMFEASGGTVSEVEVDDQGNPAPPEVPESDEDEGV
jgi:hypothetical protein